MKPVVLFIGTVFPEPTSSAAGSRMLQLISFFQTQNYTVHFASSAQVSTYSFPLQELNVETHEIHLNCSSFDEFIGELDPKVVVFDRFMTEEQYAWRVQENCPDAIRILDSEDLHFLRHARQVALKKNKQQLNFLSDITFREVASILRCDFTLIISQFEMDLLQKEFKIPAVKLHYLPFLIDNSQVKYVEDFEDTADFFFIGNFLHAPNVDAVVQLKTEIWPRISKQLPSARLFIYGAYPTSFILQMDQPSARFFVKGRAESVTEIMKSGRVNLAPIRFGAGLKGKLLDGMIACRPSVTTYVGAEGMYVSDWHGFISEDWTDFSTKAVKLYTDKNTWIQANKLGVNLLNKLFNKQLHSRELENKLNAIQAIQMGKNEEYFQVAMLNFHSFQKLKFFSKWIEEKNKKNN